MVLGRPQVQHESFLPHDSNIMKRFYWFQKHGRDAILYQKDSALILQLLLTMVESMIGTWHSWEASHHTTHMWLTLVDLAGNLSNTLQMIQYFMTVLISIVSGIEHGHQQDLYVNGKQRHYWWLNSQLLLQIDDCEWIQCVDPPLPEGMNLKNDFDGTPYEFGENATYTCASPNFYFEEDKNMESFTVECLIGGRWKYPSPSPKCAKSK